MELIKEVFDKVITHSQEYDFDVKTDKLFEMWKENKQHFYEAFGQKYIYEIPNVSFELDEATKFDRFNKFIDYLWGIGYDDLSEFVKSQREGFYKNNVISDYDAPNGKKITRNTKLVKAFKHFIADNDDLTKAQNKASQIIQENVIEGTLCFSIHPLDFLSSSENTHKWRSCHALDGEYRAGNLSYMADSSTIMVYLKSAADVVLPHFPPDVKWNNKKWRMLLHFSEHHSIVFAGRQYPFESQTAMEIVRKVLMEQLRKVQAEWSNKSVIWSNWMKEGIKSFEEGTFSVFYPYNYYPIGTHLVPLNDLVRDAENATHFNDVLRSSYYTPQYMQLVKEYHYYVRAICGEDFPSVSPHVGKGEKITVGAGVPCVQCGKHPILEGSDTMRCYFCELNYGTTENDMFGFCACCGTRLDTNNGYYYDEQLYCKECYEESFDTCSMCGDTYPKESMYVDDDGEYVCCYCNRERGNSYGTW